MNADVARSRLREAVAYAPPSGPVAGLLLGVWTPEGLFVCAPCVGRLIGRGCGHLIHNARQAWADRSDEVGACATCGALPAGSLTLTPED